MAKVSRRQFLKTLGLAGTATLAGCSDPVRHLIPYVIPPEDIVPGEATWYASTCRECPAGCGILVKNRDGHVIKVEGNPGQPINTGRLCPRGQASVQGLYDPDRYKGPMMKNPDGALGQVSWETAEDAAAKSLSAAGRKGAVVFMSHLMTGAEEDLAVRLMRILGGEYIVYEPFAYEPLRRANQIVFGKNGLPTYHIEQADFLLSFGANFLETWISNVQFARQFASFHEPGENGKHPFVYVGPRLSMTAANADYWVAVPVGGESCVALGLLRLLLQERPSLTGAAGRLAPRISAFTPSLVEERTGVKADVLLMMAAQFKKAARPLVLAEGMAFQDPNAFDTAVAANLLCTISPGSRQLLDFSSPVSLGQAAPASEIKALTDRITGGEVSALIIYRANPAYNLPASWAFAPALKMTALISFSSFPDETTRLATLLMPSHTFLESWGDYRPQRNVRGLLQPAMGPLFATRPLGDMLLSLGRKIGGQAAFPENSFYEVLRGRWEQGRKEQGITESPDAFWQQSLKRGGAWQQGKGEAESPAGDLGGLAFSTPAVVPRQKEPASFDFFTYPTIRFFDGHPANRPFLQEMPDPVTQVTWDGWVEINPDTARAMRIEKGDVLVIRAGNRTVQAPAFLYAGIPPGSLAMPVGYGHGATSGRYAAGEAGNPNVLFSGQLDPSGGLIRSFSGVTIEKTGRSVVLANADGSAYQHGRRLAQSLSFREYLGTRGHAPALIMPLPSGWDKKRDFYPGHEHVDYRWGMVIDLDRCIGCLACVVACYAENNVGIVGKRNVAMGRQMSWLHIERYFEPGQPMVRFLPMLCQHCDSAPCESVCPVFAPHHNKEGINNQVYNRCIGTRDCNENCPWKVRRFNWFTWTHDHPLEWQLNPDVTVRQKGVMEKCSFCIQRVVYAKRVAAGEGRKVRDGEFTTACAQTCPADAIVFGSLMDPESRVSRLAKQARAYQVLGGLNTKTAVIYLKKITQELG